jgi:hypothetical protein
VCVGVCMTKGNVALCFLGIFEEMFGFWSRIGQNSFDQQQNFVQFDGREKNRSGEK